MGTNAAVVINSASMMTPTVRLFTALLLMLALILFGVVFCADKHSGAPPLSITSGFWGRFQRHPILWASLILILPTVVLYVTLNLSALERLTTSQRMMPTPEQQKAQVWAQSKSGLYNCAGTKSYGTIKPGSYTSQAQALEGGYRPATGELCP